MGKYSIKDSLASCESYKNQIMGLISGALNKHEIKFTSNSSNTEITVKNSSASNIKQMIYNELTVPKPVIQILIDVSESGSGVYIRQKFN